MRQTTFTIAERTARLNQFLRVAFLPVARDPVAINQAKNDSTNRAARNFRRNRFANRGVGRSVAIGWMPFTCAAVVLLLPAVPCHASAFALREQSVTAQGNAFAGGAAAAEDPSYMFFNPAALARQGPSQVVIATTVIMPRTNLDVKGASTAAGIPISGGNGGSDVTDDHLLPAVYLVADMSHYVDIVDNFKVGLAVTSPYGLETDYSGGWAGRYYALNSKLTSVNIGPTVSFDVLDGLSVGAGLQVQYVNAEFSNAIDFGSMGASIPPLAPFARPTEQDGEARVTGDDWGVGWTAGLLYEPFAGTRVGVAYRSSVQQNLQGNGRFQLDSAGIGQAISQQTGAFTNTGASAKLETPESVTFGVYQDLDEQWSIMADATWTRWSSVDEVCIRFDNPAQPDAVTAADWKDTWFVATGITYRPSDAWAVRVGAAYDESPVPRRTRTPRIPDNDRYLLSIGTSYSPVPSIALSAAYTHFFGTGASIDLSSSGPDNHANGNLSSNVVASVDVIGVQLRWTF